MSATAAWRAGVASDTGLQRTNNEDRVFVDEAAGIFLVVDGVGGQAAGEKAAETAVEIIVRELAANEGQVEHRIREAITAANNEIYRLAEAHPDWRGMACVLTLACAHDDQVTAGHVGDSRLYLVSGSHLRKVTSDHSPVGEQEDHGGITEAEAMSHPRRNEVFRDVGSTLRDAYEEEFIEIRSFPFPPQSALLLCSDGLTDVVSAAEINALVQTYEADAAAVAHRLVDAANQHGGKDNISVIFVPGAEFHGVASLGDARARHAITRPRLTGASWRTALERLLWLGAGILLGVGLWLLFPRVLQRSVPTVPLVIVVNPADPRGVQKSLSTAHPGDTVQVPPGEYLGPVAMRDGVNLLSEQPYGAVIHADPSATGADKERAIVARGVQAGRLSGFRIEGASLFIADSSIQVDDLEITGARTCAVFIEGASKGVLRANYIHNNPGCGISITGQNSTRLRGNRIAGNGLRGVEIHSPAAPLLDNNVISGNGIQDFGALPPGYERDLRQRNIFDAVENRVPAQTARP